ncbi:MAG TPA: AraC family transcriptional regulator [Vicinamibacterales bacterium]|nr:AraC family transcriptional regulator [Vicinamibacterales bacterium]
MRASADITSTATPGSAVRRPFGVPPIVPAVRRRRLFDSPIALVETLTCAGERRAIASEGFSADFQVCLPYRGLFIWHVGEDDVVGDTNQVLFVSGGEAYRLSDPLPGGYSELILTPDPEVLSELASDTNLAAHPLFRRRSRRADPCLQRMRARMLRWANAGDRDDEAGDEVVLGLLRSALGAGPVVPQPSSSTRRLIRRTKEFLEAHLAAPLRLRDVARAVGASPAYLTDVFRRVEGVPLHQYVIQLRLSRALVELPHASDLTRLAFDLGFSSHSHFAAAFRRAFGCTPSAFREEGQGKGAGRRRSSPSSPLRNQW